MNVSRLLAAHQFVPLVKAWTILVICAGLSGCVGYVPGAKSYWDTRLRELCAKDGGVTIHKKVFVTQAELDRMKLGGEFVSIPPKQSARPDSIVFSEDTITVLHDSNPRVWRSEESIRRRKDGTLVATIVRYSRIGGDPPSPSHPSQFGCPDERKIFAQREGIFAIRGVLQ